MQEVHLNQRKFLSLPWFGDHSSNADGLCKTEDPNQFLQPILVNKETLYIWQ